MWPEGATSSGVPGVMQFAGGERTIANLGYDALPVPGWVPLAGVQPS
jgi:hypothetical protein